MKFTPPVKFLVGILLTMLTVAGCNSNNKLDERTKWLVEKDQLVDELHRLINDLSEEDLKVIWKKDNEEIIKQRQKDPTLHISPFTKDYRNKVLFAIHNSVGVVEIMHKDPKVQKSLEKCRQHGQETSGRVQQYYKAVVKLLERSLEEGRKKGLSIPDPHK